MKSISIKIPSLIENIRKIESFIDNAKQEFESWIIKGNDFVTTKLIANASHGMLKADSFSSQTFGLQQWIKLMWLEDDAFAPEFIPTILRWLEQPKNQSN